MMMETVRDACRKGDRRGMWLELGKVAALGALGVLRSLGRVWALFALSVLVGVGFYCGVSLAAAKLPSPVKVVYLLAAPDAAEGETQEGEQ
uniref:hypothetical protein n=1 Tax=Aeromonas caviae TaxID=648 RepID=UPI0029527432|nr:hypothetical protein [Aeromonas caviae]WNV60260.1 hypothetical protein LNGCBEGE_00064 [Aeromonas caviae]